MKISILAFAAFLFTNSSFGNSYAASLLVMKPEDFKKIQVITVSNDLPSTGNLYPAKVETIQEFFQNGKQLWYRSFEELEQRYKPLSESFAKFITDKEAGYFTTGFFVTKDYKIYRFNFYTHSLIQISRISGGTCFVQLENPKFVRTKSFPRVTEYTISDQ